MYKIGYKAYGITIINIIWPENIKCIKDTWHWICPYYYVRFEPYKYKALFSYQLISLLEQRKYQCIKIIEFANKLMLEK
jgi:hypothetical protein